MSALSYPQRDLCRAGSHPPRQGTSVSPALQSRSRAVSCQLISGDQQVLCDTIPAAVPCMPLSISSTISRIYSVQEPSKPDKYRCSRRECAISMEAESKVAFPWLQAPTRKPLCHSDALYSSSEAGPCQVPSDLGPAMPPLLSWSCSRDVAR